MANFKALNGKTFTDSAIDAIRKSLSFLSVKIGFSYKAFKFIKPIARKYPKR